MIIEKCQVETVANRNTTQRNTAGKDKNNTDSTTQHDKTPNRYEIDGQAGRSTKNSTEKLGQKTLQICSWLSLFFSHLAFVDIM